MSFTDQKPFTATAEDCKRDWACGKPGEHFRCGLCGHKFVTGDVVRWQFTNNLPGYGGNPFVCKPCDGPDVVEKWKALVNEWKLTRNDDRFATVRRLFP